MLSNIGTVIGLQSGPLTDQFFLTFDVLGSHTNVVVEATPATPAPAPGPVVADIGVRTFAQINSTLSHAHGRADDGPDCQRDLPGRAAAAAADPDARRLLLREPGRRRAVGDSVLQ